MSLALFPSELINLIATHCSPAQAVILARANKRMLRICLDEQLWEQYLTRDYPAYSRWSHLTARQQYRILTTLLQGHVWYMQPCFSAITDKIICSYHTCLAYPVPPFSHSGRWLEVDIDIVISATGTAQVGVRHRDTWSGPLPCLLDPSLPTFNILDNPNFSYHTVTIEQLRQLFQEADEKGYKVTTPLKSWATEAYFPSAWKQDHPDWFQ